MSNIQLAKNLKYLRDKHNLTQDDMGELLSISRQAYSNYETMKRMPDIDILMTLANYYQVNLNNLVLCKLSESYVPFEGLSEGTIPYIASKTEKTGKSIYLSEEEVEIILKFRSLSPEKQQLIKGFLLHE